jgi:hypothetical protein
VRFITEEGEQGSGGKMGRVRLWVMTGERAQSALVVMSAYHGGEKSA